MGGIVLSRGLDSLDAEVDVVAARCESVAAGGHVRAALALVLTGAATTAVVPLARQRLSSIVQPRTHRPGHYDFSGGWQHEALLSVVLTSADRAVFANEMIMVVEDPAELAWNKSMALEALATVARHLDDAVRNDCLPAALDVARGDQDGSTDDGLTRDHPLNRFRVNIGGGTLRHDGLFAAAALAHTAEQYTEVVALAQELMPHAALQEANRIARALAFLPASRAGLDPVSLAAHGSEWIRALAATVWCSTGGEPAQLGSRLATDPSVHVRRALAAHLPYGSAHDELRAALLKDIRRSVRGRIRYRLNGTVTDGATD